MTSAMSVTSSCLSHDVENCLDLDESLNVNQAQSRVCETLEKTENYAKYENHENKESDKNEVKEESNKNQENNQKREPRPSCDESGIESCLMAEGPPHRGRTPTQVYQSDSIGVHNSAGGDHRLCSDRTNVPEAETKINQTDMDKDVKLSSVNINVDIGGYCIGEDVLLDINNQSNTAKSEQISVKQVGNENTNADSREEINKDFIAPKSTPSPKPKKSSNYEKEVSPKRSATVIVVERPTGDKDIFIEEEVENVFLQGPENRKQFLIKCYMIVCADLMFMFTIMTFVTFAPGVMPYVKDTLMIPLSVFSAICLIISCILMCCFSEEITRSPWSWLLNGSVVLGFTTSTTLLACHYSQENVAIAMGSTVAVVVVLTCIAFFTPFDFTGCLPFMLACLIVFAIFGVVLPFAMNQNSEEFKWIDYILNIVGAIIFSVYIIIDTQMLMDGKRYSLTTDMYVFGATMLFIDIVHLLIYILRILGRNM